MIIENLRIEIVDQNRVKWYHEINKNISIDMDTYRMESCMLYNINLQKCKNGDIC